MRDKARKMGLHPRVIAAPEWTHVPWQLKSVPAWLLTIVY
ncbi:hypothetical protein J842_1231 [Acinetobacter baumannii 25935_9]|nr:hypothetical protein J842_1231 [Acinetobacter baumannii 25935_9]